MSVLHPFQQRARELRKAFNTPRIKSTPVVAYLAPVAEPTPANRMHYDEPIGPLLDQVRDLREWRVAAPRETILILARVMCAHRLTWGQIFGETRRQPYVKARWEIYYRLRAAGWSLMKIARFMQRDHTTCLHGICNHALNHGLPPLTNSASRRAEVQRATHQAYHVRRMAARS